MWENWKKKRNKQYALWSVKPTYYNDDELGFNDASTHESHLRQNGVLTWFCNETAIIMSHICIKC